MLLPPSSPAINKAEAQKRLADGYWTPACFNDNVAPTSQAELLEYGTAQQHFMDRPRKVSFVPKIKMGGTDIVASSIVPVIESRPLFLSTNQAKIGHYGLRWAFSPTLQQTDTVVNVYIEAEIEFKLTK